MKPIEEGCLAVITRSVVVVGNEGRVVTVGRYLGRQDGWETPDDHWAVDKPLMSKLGIPTYHAPEAYLLRIDGHEETEDERQERIKGAA